MKTCRKCETTKPYSEFRKHKGYADNHRNHCIKCENAYARENYTPKSSKFRMRKWRKNNPIKNKAARDKYRKRSSGRGFYTAQEIKYQYEWQSGKFCYCNTDLSDGYSIEHLIPVSRNGSNTIGNIALVCSYCNSSKGNKTPLEYLDFAKESRIEIVPIMLANSIYWNVRN